MVLIFFGGLVVGAIAGFIAAAFLTASSNYDDLVDAYNDGFIDGKEVASKNTDNMNNALNNEYNDTRY